MESKNTLAAPVAAGDITSLCRQIKQWRRRRRGRESMPEPLWSQAAIPARRHGISRISRIAKLHYYALQKRVGSLYREGATEPQTRPMFVELPLPVSGPECILELEHPRGGRMRIQIKGSPLPDFAALADGFWRMET